KHHTPASLILTKFCKFPTRAKFTATKLTGFCSQGITIPQRMQGKKHIENQQNLADFYSLDCVLTNKGSFITIQKGNLQRIVVEDRRVSKSINNTTEDQQGGINILISSVFTTNTGSYKIGVSNMMHLVFN
ncbi:unnamed protein product, partial [Ilex paraguariensis]